MVVVVVVVVVWWCGGVVVVVVVVVEGGGWPELQVFVCVDANHLLAGAASSHTPPCFCACARHSVRRVCPPHPVLVLLVHCILHAPCSLMRLLAPPGPSPKQRDARSNTVLHSKLNDDTCRVLPEMTTASLAGSPTEFLVSLPLKWRLNDRLITERVK